MLEQTIWLWNHTFHSKFYFNEFVANAFRDNIGMTSEVVEVSLFALWQEQKCWHRNLLCIWVLVTGRCNEWNIVPCPSMWQKQFWSVQKLQNSFGLTKLIHFGRKSHFGLDHNDLVTTKMKWSRPKWIGQVKSDIFYQNESQFGPDQFILVVTISFWSRPNHYGQVQINFGPTKTVLVT